MGETKASWAPQRSGFGGGGQAEREAAGPGMGAKGLLACWFPGTRVTGYPRPLKPLANMGPLV